MARMRLIDYLSHPEKLDEKSLDSLKEALDTYPFFQAGRMLWVKNLHQLDHIRYNSELKLSAAFIPDRSKLFFLINDVFTPLSAPDDQEELSVDGNGERESSFSEESETAGKSDPTGKKPDEKERTPQDDCPGEHLQRIVGAEANYFEVDDSFTTSSGDLVDFSLSRADDNEKGYQQKEEVEEKEDFVFPQAGALDYEKEIFTAGYSLEEEVPSEPVDFRQSHSFSEWLDLLKYRTLESEEEKSVTEPSERKKPGKMDLIDNFLSSGGHQKRIVPGKARDDTNKDFSAGSVVESEDLMTETLANIHIKQERYQKAVEIFERLRLKYPEKSVYFARRIKEMEDLINNQ